MSALLAQLLKNSGNPSNVTDCEETLHLMSIDANEARGDLNDALTNLNRLVDIATHLDETIQIGECVKKASVPELALMSNAFDLAMAGEPGDHSQVCIAMQSNEGRAINMQGIRNVVSSVWEAIKSLAKRIRDAVVKFFKSRWGDSARLRKKLKALLSRCDKVQSKSVEHKKTKINGGYKNLHVAGQAPKGKVDFEAEAEKFLSLATAMFGDYITNINKAGNALQTALDKFDVSEKLGGLGLDDLKGIELTSLATDRSVDKLFSEANNDKTAPKHHTRKKLELLGNKTMFSTVEHDLTDLAPGELANVASRSMISLESFSTKKTIEDSGEIDTLEVEVIRTMTNTLLEALSILDAFEDSTEYKEIDKLNKSLRVSGDSVNKEIGDKEADMGEGAKEMGKALHKFVSGYATWTSSGFSGFSAHFNTIATTLVKASNESLSNYK